MTDEERVELITQIASNFGISCDNASYIIKSFENFGKEYMMSIEEDIERLNKLVTTKFNNDYSIDNIDKEAIEHLLSDYTRQKQINEEHQKINGELRKKVKGLEEYIFVAPNLDEMTATKYLAIQRESYVKGRAEEQQKAKQIIYENYIPKQKIKDKIDEINKKYEDSKDENGESPYYYPEYTIRVLKKLLQEREDI